MSAASLNFLAAHPSGMGGVEYAVHDGEVTLVTCGQDGHICIRKADDPAEIKKAAQAEGAAGHCLAVSKVTKQFAVGDQGHFVKVKCT